MIPNQAPDTSVHGLLQPLAEPPQFDGQPLEDYLQQYVAAVSYLDGTLVRPRWQTEPIPNLPDFATPCWCAVGVVRRRPLGTYAWVGRPETIDTSQMQRHEELEVLCSFYGREAEEHSSTFHDNLMVWQNQAWLRLAEMAFVEIGEAVYVPELIKEQWLERIDKRLTLRRIVRRTYPILDFVSVAGVVIPDPPGTYRAPFSVTKGGS